MTQAQTGNNVKVHYTGRLDNGQVFDSSAERDPLEFTLGQGQLIPGFEKAVSGMQVGDKKTVTIPAEDAYGTRQEELLFSVERTQLPDHIQPEVGQQLQVSQDGQATVVTVADLTDTTIVLDANHPLAGENLTFDLEVVEVA
ncbi:FKBP-type peptidyl-prolyl cis-trans isomerase 2 [Desulfonatronum thiosulfatophilum]|uniref:Peptidyl-prolyl cis-trans isomerase n=1 Tax=Desulfonatronum thiosulfatophilum TaxID=617002 RepID=A0A1G6D630_9BACT|nr:peptidylprolyl isomerase [Desulfonatronum thiosulfatophilum]SDB40550.1 FKBP-type peptidyl-prolyl cis-trans isomerase 2 [Desulfonatronum thiosulfatophilum]